MVLADRGIQRRALRLPVGDQLVERLLVFEASQGWEPLCAFLGVPVPDTPYPRENSTADFQARVAAGTMSDPEAVKAVVDQARAH